jgi:osmotically inducible lipoprotein OsmB
MGPKIIFCGHSPSPSPEVVMKTKILSLLLVPLMLSLSACGDTWGQRAVTGGGIGAGTGLAVGALAGFPLLGSALVGTALGAGIGAATAPGGIK